MANRVSEAVIKRLPNYYRHLTKLEAEGVRQISSQEMGERMQQTPSQIRQDINCFGGFGRQGYGYDVTALKEHISEILGLDKPHRMIILGAGSIGRAVARYPTFSREKFETIAMFDNDPAKVGSEFGGIKILPIEQLESFLAANTVDIAVVALPAEIAQEMLDRVNACGIKAVWNFAPLDLEHPEDMIVVNVHLSDSLKILSYKMAHRNEAEQ